MYGSLGGIILVKKIVDNKRNYLFMLICMAIIMFIFYRSLYWPEAGFSWRKLVEALIIVFFIAVLPVLTVSIKSLNGIIDTLFRKCGHLKEFIKAHKKKTIVYVVITVAIYPVLFLIMHNFTENEHIIGAASAVCYVIFFLYALRNYASKRVEILFAIVALVLGSFQISSITLVPGISADDEIHYERTLVLANGLSGFFYQSEVDAIENYTNVIVNADTHEKKTRIVRYEELNKKYDEKIISEHSFEGKGIWSVAYIPSALGIIFARGLSLPFTATLFMGKFFSLIAYIAIFYFAIKRIKTGKLLMAILGLIPTSLYLAGNFSYDAWVFAFMALGFSYFVNMSRSDDKIKTRDIIIMCIFFFVGILPKAIYVFALLPLLFLSKSKFKGKNQRVFYYIALVVMVVLLLSSFLLPLVITGGGEGDARGGTDVNAALQVQYILGNKAEFTKTLAKFLNSFLSLESQEALFQCYEYLGNGKFTVLTMIIIAIIAFVDKDKKDKLPVRVSSFVAFILCNAMAAIALYITFTPVGARTVAGFQNRYILPTLIPLLYFAFPGLNADRIKRNKLTLVSMAIVAFTFIYTIYSRSIVFYC